MQGYTTIERHYGQEEFIAEIDNQGRVGRISQMPLTTDPDLIEAFREFLGQVAKAMREATCAQ